MTTANAPAFLPFSSGFRTSPPVAGTWWLPGAFIFPLPVAVSRPSGRVGYLSVSVSGSWRWSAFVAVSDFSIAELYARYSDFRYYF